MKTLNATYTVDLDGTLTITHTDCGNTQTVKPIWQDDDGLVGYGSQADFCEACETAGRPAGLSY